MLDHPPEELEDHDRGLSHNRPTLLSRRRALGLVEPGPGTARPTLAAVSTETAIHTPTPNQTPNPNAVPAAAGAGGVPEPSEASADEVRLACADLDEGIALFEGLGYRLDAIWPADDPGVAVFSHPGRPPLRLVRAEVADGLVSDGVPDGVTTYELTRPELTDTGVGRAGMHYRDLLPSRQGGRWIASHILIPDGGEVPDYVHHHRVRFQLIYCAAGWVEVVYEDQGEPFVLQAGDCVLQPPGIRHRVLRASPALEVVELGCPAEHATFVEHEIPLPGVVGDAERRWDGQRFVRHVATAARYEPWRVDGFEARDTGIAVATDGLAAVRVVRPLAGTAGAELPPYDGEFLFWYVLSGTATVAVGGRPSSPLATGSALSVPAAEPYRLADVSPDLELLEVSLPG